MNNPGSLQNLNDIVAPAAAGWWPVAPGWYVVAGLFLAGLVIVALRQWRRWRRNRYRRLALEQLAVIRSDKEALSQLPQLLKRAALCAWPREEVASLSGAAWHRFLDETAGTGKFGQGAGELLDQLSYNSAGREAWDSPARELVLDAAEFWLQHHQFNGQEG
jgi:hypothetical protein